MSPFDVIKTVRLTEKVMAVQERNDATAERLGKKTRQQIHLVADPRATKNDIRDAVQTLWSVKVDRVNTMNVTGRCAASAPATRVAQRAGRKPSSPSRSATKSRSPSPIAQKICQAGAVAGSRFFCHAWPGSWPISSCLAVNAIDTGRAAT